MAILYKIVITKSRLILFVNNYNNLFHCQISYILENSLSWFSLLVTVRWSVLLLLPLCRCCGYSARCNKKVLWQTFKVLLLILIWEWEHWLVFQCSFTAIDPTKMGNCIVCRKSTEFDSIVVKTVSPKNCLPQNCVILVKIFWTEKVVIWPTTNCWPK